MDFEVGGRDESTFLRLLERLPDAERYETDAYGVYGALPVNKHQQAYGRKVRGGELERGIAFYAAREIEQAGSSDEGLHKERGYAGESACAGLLRQAQTQYHSPLRIPTPL